ncbi:MAG: formylglycine-generating enzyme family protein [Chitinivibrionia bacterium]|nr:formylglycine-generating enzyme family protein [Chitinivibrionia bacterium]
MMGSVKALSAVAYLFLILFAVGCGDDDNGEQTGTTPGGGQSGGQGIQTAMIQGIECVWVKAGSFTMGGSNFGNSSTQQVTLTQDYWISKYPITNAQFGKTVEGKSDHPVVNVTWTQANEFAQSRGGFLPTEAQWEFAARGGVNSKGYIYSGSNTIGDVAWYSGNSGGSTHPVGQKQANELGIHDMSGNVWEWCSDWYGSYSTTAVTNPTGPSTADFRV